MNLNDIAVYKCIAEERLVMIKEETYGNQSYYKRERKQYNRFITLMINVFTI